MNSQAVSGSGEATNNDALGLSEIFDVIRTHLLGMRRYRWWSLACAWLICIAGWYVVYTMDDVYEANARIYVDTENVLEPLLRGIAVSTNVMDEVTVVTRELLSRPNLAAVARETDLDLDAETPQQFENLLTSLQSRIDVKGSRERIFSVTFEHSDRDKAQAVVQSLVDTFVEKSLGADRSDSVQAQTFLREQIDLYEARLTVAEDKLASFRRENVEFMPGQRGDYFSRLQAAELQLDQTRAALKVAQERKTELERQIAGESPALGGQGGGQAGTTSTFAAEKIQQLEAELEVLRLRYTDKHPRIGQIQETLDLLRTQKISGGSTSQDAASAQDAVSLNPVYQNMRIQLSNVDVEIASLRASERQHLSEASQLRRLVDTVPQVEAELGRLNRDYDIVKAKYEQLVQQLETANIGDNVARSIDDVQFRLIDPPYADAIPTGPNRPLLAGGVFLLAIAGAVALAFVANQLNLVFFSGRSVTEATGIPVLASISRVETLGSTSSDNLNRRLLMMACLLLATSYVLISIFAEQGSALLR